MHCASLYDKDVISILKIKLIEQNYFLGSETAKFQSIEITTLDTIQKYVTSYGSSFENNKNTSEL